MRCLPERNPIADERSRFAGVAIKVLQEFVGPQGVRSVLFYTGAPDSDGFEENLRKVFGAGAALMIQEFHRRLGKSP
jgi:hypothetical protein